MQVCYWFVVSGNTQAFVFIHKGGLARAQHPQTCLRSGGRQRWKLRV